MTTEQQDPCCGGPDVESQVGAKKGRNMWAISAPDFWTLYCEMDKNSTGCRNH